MCPYKSILAFVPVTLKSLTLQHLGACGSLWAPGPPFLSLRPYWRERARNGSCAPSAVLRLLGYMDTLVHFGRFSLAALANSKIDSWLVAN